MLIARLTDNWTYRTNWHFMNSLETAMIPLPEGAISPHMAEGAAYAGRLIRDSKSSHTLRAYKGALRRLDSWIEDAPLTDQAIAAYLGHLDAEGKSPVNAQTTLAAVKWRCEMQDEPNPIGRLSRHAMQGFRRAGRSERGRGQSDPITMEDACKIISTSKPIDAAIAAVLFQGGLRRSEAAGLEWRDIRPAGDLPGALLIEVRKSKTNQEGVRRDVRLLKGVCAQAVAAIRPVFPEANAKVLGLCAASIHRRFQDAAKSAGIEGRITSHSGRIGLASELTRRGASTAATALAGGWKSPAMVVHYSTGASAERGAVARYF